MGKFERRTRKKVEAEAKDFADLPGKMVMQVKVDHGSGEGAPLYHTVMDCNGQELMQAMAIMAADFCASVAANGGSSAGLELVGFMAQVQLGAASVLEQKGG